MTRRVASLLAYNLPSPTRYKRASRKRGFLLSDPSRHT